MHQLPGGLDPGSHFRQTKGNRLMLEDRFAKSLPFMGVVQGMLERGPRHADGLGRDTDAPGGKIGQGDAVALPFPAQHQVSWHRQIFKRYLRRIGTALA